MLLLYVKPCTPHKVSPMRKYSTVTLVLILLSAHLSAMSGADKSLRTDPGAQRPQALPYALCQQRRRSSTLQPGPCPGRSAATGTASALCPTPATTDCNMSRAVSESGEKSSCA